jgi:predicted  nucleic acid-binding Zn-ribbon protein
MSDTPRTNARVKQMIDNGQSAEGLEYFARQLERELNAANERINRLEVAGNQLKDRYILENENWDLKTVNDWNEAKEAKP